MTKRIKGALLAFLGISLCGCSNVSELYPSGQYESAVFENNYYTGRHDFLKTAGMAIKNIEISPDKYFNGDSAADFGRWKSSAPLQFDGTDVIRKGLVSRHPEVLKYTKKSSDGGEETVTLSTDSLMDWRYADVGEDARFVGTSFGRTKCLATIDPAFKNGFLSKLYNGQLYCNGDHMRALVQLDRNGYDASFPKSMVSGDYFLISMRGGSTYTTPVSTAPRFAGANLNAAYSTTRRLTEIDVNLKFYKANGPLFDYYSITAKDVVLRTDDGGDGVTFFGFKFSDIGIEDTSQISGMSFSYSNFRDPAVQGIEETCDVSTPKKFYWGALLYEVMFPDSSWR